MKRKGVSLDKKRIKKIKTIVTIFFLIIMGLGGMVTGDITLRQDDWSIEIIDTAVTDTYRPERYPSLALDTSGYPHISYYDIINGSLMYSYKYASSWHTETVYEPPVKIGDAGQYTSLALDSNGYPHISYYGKIRIGVSPSLRGVLMYSYKDAGGWTTGIVDSDSPGKENVGEYTSLALDSNDYPHISYYDETNADLRYTYWDGTDWNTETVYSTGTVGRYTSLALDSNDYPHISYTNTTDWDNYELKYAYKDTGGWHNDIVESTYRIENVERSFSHTSLVLDSNDYPHISYTHAKCFEVLVASVEMVTLNGDSGDIDDTSDLMYAYKDASGWHKTIVDEGQYTCHNYGSSLVLDSNSYPHISYYGGGLKYTYWDGTDWDNMIVDSEGQGGWTSLALDNNDYFHISYCVNDYWEDKSDARYAYQDGSGWHRTPVDNNFDVGLYTSLALDDNGYPHISYYDKTRGYCKYTYWTGTVWHDEIVDVYGGPWSTSGEWTSLALDSNGYPHISYYFNDFDLMGMGPVHRGDLIYAHWDGDDWHTKTIDSTGDVGRFTSLALDSHDYPHISYYDATNGDLKYAYKQYYNGGGWYTETVDSTGDVGRYTSLALDSNDYPHISYMDYREAEQFKLDIYMFASVEGINSNADIDFDDTCNLKYASKDMGGWHNYTVHSSELQYPPAGENIGYWTSLALDSKDRPHISYSDGYYSGYGGNLWYAHWLNLVSGWDKRIVDDTGYVGGYTSLALDTNDYAHISHYDWGNDDLKLFYRDADGWHNTTVDSIGDVGRYTSLALGSNDCFHISYYDRKNGDLKYVKELCGIDTWGPRFFHYYSNTSAPILLEDSTPDESTNITVIVTDESTVSSVTINLSSLGWSSSVPLTRTPGTDIWYRLVNATSGTAIHDGTEYVPHSLVITASDEYGNVNTDSVPVIVWKNGDVSGEGMITLYDATYLAKWYFNQPGFEYLPEVTADVSGDGMLTLYDATYLAKWYFNQPGFEELH